jgi:hypothetical protein
MGEITKGIVDLLELRSVHVATTQPIHRTYEVVLEMGSDKIEEPVFGHASCFSDGYVMCQTISDLRISDLAKKELRERIRAVAAEVMRQLRGF